MNKTTHKCTKRTDMDAYIRETAREIRERFPSASVEEIAEELGILVGEARLGQGEGANKGFALMAHGIRHITVNEDLSGEMKQVILAHELGHVLLHMREGSEAVFRDEALFSLRLQGAEYEANLFAAELLLRKEDLLEALEEASSLRELSQLLRLPEELILLKLQGMEKRGEVSGIRLRESRSSFLGEPVRGEWEV